MNVAVHHLSQLEENDLARTGRAEAEVTFRIVLQWIGKDIGRDALRETPARLVRAFNIFTATPSNARQILHRTFKETDGFYESEFRCDG